MVGRGTPSATQVKLASSGETIVMLTGPVVIFGGTIERNCSYSLLSTITGSRGNEGRSNLKSRVNSVGSMSYNNVHSGTFYYKDMYLFYLG